jgi:hypothetical protein
LILILGGKTVALVTRNFLYSFKNINFMAGCTALLIQ